MKLTARGRATRTVEENGIRRTTEEKIEVQQTYDDPREFDLNLYTSPSKTAEVILPDDSNYVIMPDQEDSWSYSLNANAVEISEFAEELAESDFGSGRTTTDILTAWLQRLPSMRVRRALHSHLRENEGVDVEHVD